MVAPILDEIATENADQMTIAKLNVDENPDIAMRYQVMSIPTMIVFNGGEAVHRIVGAKSKSVSSRSSKHFWATPTNPRRARRSRQGSQRRLIRSSYPIRPPKAVGLVIRRKRR